MFLSDVHPHDAWDVKIFAHQMRLLSSVHHAVIAADGNG